MSEPVETPHDTGAEATVESLAKDLADLGVQSGQVLLVHSSLRSIGRVCGGPVAVIRALDAALGSGGTLVMPAHTSQLCDPALRRDVTVPRDRIETTRNNLPVFDPLQTPTTGMGLIPETFRSQAAVLRSNHPHDSFAARGPRARSIVSQHSLHDGLGEESPLAALYNINAGVLLLGVGHDSSTCLHLAEYRAKYPGKRMLRNGAPMIVDNERQWVVVEHLQYRSYDFNRLGQDYARQTREVSYGYVGRAQSMLMPVRGLVDFAVDWMDQNR